VGTVGVAGKTAGGGKHGFCAGGTGGGVNESENPPLPAAARPVLGSMPPSLGPSPWPSPALVSRLAQSRQGKGPLPVIVPSNTGVPPALKTQRKLLHLHSPQTASLLIKLSGSVNVYTLGNGPLGVLSGKMVETRCPENVFSRVNLTLCVDSGGDVIVRGERADISKNRECQSIG
jgi:hypothetical protein